MLRRAGAPLTDAAADFVHTIQSRILDRFPAATFDVRVGPDGRVYLAVYSEATQDFDVQDLVADRTVDALIRGEVKVHVFPRRLPSRSPSTTPRSPR